MKTVNKKYNLVDIKRLSYEYQASPTGKFVKITFHGFDNACRKKTTICKMAPGFLRSER